MRMSAVQPGSSFNDEVPGSAREGWRCPSQGFVGLPIAQAALRFAQVRHDGQYREVDHAPFMAHAIEVGWLLCWDGQSEEVIAAGLLHDVLEKTATTAAELDRRFGARIVGLVESVSDDPSITDYESRKRELRHRVAQAGPDTRAIFAADKIAKVRELALLRAQSLREPAVRAKLRHYRASLRMLHRAAGELGLVDLLDAEFERVAARTATTRKAGRSAERNRTRKGEDSMSVDTREDERREEGGIRPDVERVAQELEAASDLASSGELLQPLSDAELAVLRLLAGDLSIREIGERLFVSQNTIRSHTRALYPKLDVHTRADAIARATALGLLEQTQPPR
jgi:DNA-binding CsgD family transcriptional regulator